ncbi:MAG TPA: hypothetical protein VMU01_11570 [Rhizomicrobium sp.]|nr:hypothetical protein [Rhizomicrobium sp.]
MSSSEASGVPAANGNLEFSDLIKAADALIQTQRLGGYGRFIAPFTSQFKASLRESFPADMATFQATDTNERKAIVDALKMRCITFAVFLAFTAGLCLIVTDRMGFDFGDPTSALHAFLIFLACAGLAWALRYWIRHEYLHTIGGDATLFANYFFKELTNIHDRAINAIRASNSDLMLSSAWPERSAGWIKIALWYGKRYENLDRYVTAAAWRVESRYRIIERSFVALKSVTLVAVVAWIAWHLWRTPPAHPYGWILILAAAAAYVAITLLWWGVRNKTSNAYWAERFRVSVVGFDEQKEHIYNQVANVVAGDKKMLMSDKRNVGEKKNS